MRLSLAKSPYPFYFDVRNGIVATKLLQTRSPNQLILAHRPLLAVVERRVTRTLAISGTGADVTALGRAAPLALRRNTRVVTDELTQTRVFEIERLWNSHLVLLDLACGGAAVRLLQRTKNSSAE